MNAAELQALRRLLFFSTAEAARHLAADQARPHGVEERTWNRWEAGKLPVPDNVAAAVQEALAVRSQWFVDLLRAFVDGRKSASAPEHMPQALLWYAERDDFPGPAAHWRPHQSACAAVLADADPGTLHLVAFDAIAFNAWRAGQLPDTPESRQAWAYTMCPVPVPP